MVLRALTTEFLSAGKSHKLYENKNKTQMAAYSRPKLTHSYHFSLCGLLRLYCYQQPSTSFPLPTRHAFTDIAF